MTELTSSPSGPRGVKRKRSGASVRSASASAPSSPIPGYTLDPETPQMKRLKTVHERRPSGLREVVNEGSLEPALSLENVIGESQQSISSVMTESGHTGVPTTQEDVDTMSQSSEDSTEDEEDEEDDEDDFLADAFAQDAQNAQNAQNAQGGGEEEDSDSDDSDSDSSEEANG